MKRQSDRNKAQPRSMSSRSSGVLVGIALGVIGVVAMSFLGFGNDLVSSRKAPLEPAANDRRDHTAAIDQLTSALVAEVQARTKLAKRVAQMGEELARSRQANDVAPANPIVGSESPEEIASGEKAPETVVAAQSIDFDDKLLAQGMHPHDVARLHGLRADHELNRQFVTDQALSEGWFMQPRHSMELALLEAEFREALQDDQDYDNYLYATGQTNRLVAREVFPGSTAHAAGLMGGDTILRYNDVRVFKLSDLLLESSAVESGTLVRVEILQNGRPRTVHMKSGPLGVLLDQNSTAPRS